MRFVVFVKANKQTEAGFMPSQKLLAEMGKFHEELVKAAATKTKRLQAIDSKR